MAKKKFLPKKTRVYAVGDIHGALDLLENLMGMIEGYEQISPQKENIYIVFLGDYIDRGKNSKQVISYLLKKLPKDFKPIFLRGNHEEMMLNGLGDDENSYKEYDFWFCNGGKNTLRSYGFDERDDDRSKFLQKMPAKHLEFFKNLKSSFEIGAYFFCHAGIRPGVALKDQTEKELIWIRGLFLESTKQHEKIIVHGHTPEVPKHYGNRIGIDSGSVMTGKLTAVCLERDGSYQLLTATTYTKRHK